MKCYSTVKTKHQNHLRKESQIQKDKCGMYSFMPMLAFKFLISRLQIHITIEVRYRVRNYRGGKDL